ncbi:hypothetical protein [Vagococcus salmoninarum]|uniref:hypothetical protein n=1 Tax=Vagococcus salmoninarum TaxID=2739 RepID=UPI001880C67D|nr:hypothetical protein [Vagococcus salmoninarum]MBE9390016.1 hypothetical protein [Vagococcus salmoninarum]
MDALQDKMLTKLKLLKGITDDKLDDIFKFSIETALSDVLTYCHLSVEDFPELLISTVILMAIDLINETTLTVNADVSEGEVKSLTEGDFSITKETKAEAYQKIMKAPSFAKNYKRQLNAFRKLR